MGVVFDEVTADVSAPVPVISADSGASGQEAARERQVKREVLDAVERHKSRELRVLAD